MRKDRNPPTPSLSEVRKMLVMWKKNENLVVSEKALDALLEKFPQNNSVEEILLKVCAVNSLDTTHILGIFNVAKHIAKLKNIDSGLRNGKFDIVDKIARVKFNNGRIRNFYSFATKYCARHNPNVYPMYDSNVDKVLWHFRDRDKFSFLHEDLHKYEKFVDIIKKFKTCYKLEKYGFRDIDKYLYLTGKEYFN